MLSDLRPSSQAHASDDISVFFSGDLADYLINFAVRLDPNDGALLSWPKYNTKTPKLLTFQDGHNPLNITDDTFRKDAMDFLLNVMVDNPI